MFSNLQGYSAWRREERQIDPIQQQLLVARKHQILDAATVIFAEKGFHATTTRDIAKQAGISEGTIYNYFENKTALLLGIFERMRATVIQNAPPLVANDIDLRTFLHTFLSQPLKAMKHDNFALFRIIFSEMMVNEELRKQYYEHILEPTLAMADIYLQKQFPRADIRPTQIPLTVRAVSSMVLGLMVEYIMHDETVVAQWEELPDFLADLILHGLQGR